MILNILGDTLPNTYKRTNTNTEASRGTVVTSKTKLPLDIYPVIEITSYLAKVPCTGTYILYLLFI